MAPRRGDRDRAEAGGLRRRDVGGRVTDLRGRCGRAVPGTLTRERKQLLAFFGLAAECAAAGWKETRQPESLEPGSGHRLWVAGDERYPHAGALEAVEALRGAGTCLPAARVGADKELERAFRVTRAPGVENGCDRVVGNVGFAQHVASDPLGGQAAVLDVCRRLGVDLRLVRRLEGLDERLPANRVVRQEERAVEVEERQQPAQIPSRSSIASSRRHFGRVFTLSSRKI